MKTETPVRAATRYGFSARLQLPLDQAIERAKDALKAEGFGILTTIDVRATMKEKLDADFEPYVILGACNPHLAYRALQAEHEIGLLLPCNVIVHEENGGSIVSILDPAMMVDVVPDNIELSEVATEAAAKLRRVAAALAAADEAS